MQFGLTFVRHRLSASSHRTALALAVAASLTFAVTLFIVRGPIRAWMEFLEEKLEKRRKDLLASRETTN
jgi:hypothetical protein